MDLSRMANSNEENPDDGLVEDSSSVSNCCFGVPLILRKVLGHLSGPDLARCSVVNKSWNYEARSLLRDHRKFMANTSAAFPCQDLALLESQMKNMIVIPYNGLHIKMNLRDHVSSLCVGKEKEENYVLIVKELTLKYLEVECIGQWDVCEKCPAVRLVIELLRKNGSRLVELSLRISRNVAIYNPTQIEDGEVQLPMLKVLRFPAQNGSLPVHLEFLRHLLKCAPNLKELHHNAALQSLETILSDTHADIVTSYDFDPGYHLYPENIMSRVKFRQLKLLSANVNFDSNRYCRTLQLILETSSQTLESLLINCVFIAPLIKSEVALENVTKLDVWLDYRHLELVQPSLLQILKHLDFSRIFPNLKSIDFALESVDLSPEQLSLLAEGGEVFGSTDPNRATGIKQIRLYNCFKDYTARFFADMCPFVTSLTVISAGVNSIPYTEIWSSWEKLERVFVSKAAVNAGLFASNPVRSVSGANLDAVFCGIHEEEATYLQEQDDEFLQAVHIVPVKPAIMNMRHLRDLRIGVIEHGSGSNLWEENNPTYMFSKVTGWVAFSKMPDLSITIQSMNANVRRALHHMHPFVTISKETPHW